MKGKGNRKENNDNDEEDNLFQKQNDTKSLQHTWGMHYTGEPRENAVPY